MLARAISRYAVSRVVFEQVVQEQLAYEKGGVVFNDMIRSERRDVDAPLRLKPRVCNLSQSTSRWEASQKGSSSVTLGYPRVSESQRYERPTHPLTL